MNDTIDRQNVVDRLLDWENHSMTDAEAWHLRQVIGDIKSMPSAQPDIIVCADCKHWVCHDRRCGYWNHGVKPLMWCSQAERRTDE